LFEAINNLIELPDFRKSIVTKSRSTRHVNTRCVLNSSTNSHFHTSFRHNGAEQRQLNSHLWQCDSLRDFVYPSTVFRGRETDPTDYCHNICIIEFIRWGCHVLLVFAVTEKDVPTFVMFFSFYSDLYRLVMGLIMSDMLRSTLELTYPIVTLSRGDVSAASLYCEIGGFFTAYFFEASDLMIFIIAIHTAVYVFHPKLTYAGDEGGLWRWRYYVFAAWFIIPGLLAGLAFINPVPYVPLVTWCYLPARPLVWRYTLAWGPRYFIFLLISILYVALYVHVRRVYRTIDRTHLVNSSMDSGSGSDYETRRSSQHSGFGPISSHGLLNPPLPTYFQRKRPSIPPPVVEDEKESRLSTEPSVYETPSPTSETTIIQHPPQNYEQPHPPSPGLRDMSFTTTISDALPPSILNRPEASPDATQSFAHRRARVERQMRTLFIFPIVYFLMWIPPFINHLYQVITYDSTATHLPPGTFVITVLATVFLPAQGFVNVCVYAVRERPWRRRKRTEKKSTRTDPATSKSCAFRDWRGFPPVSETNPDQERIETQLAQAKKTYSKAANPAQAAYARREIERGERELARAQTVAEHRHPRSNWWETQDDIETQNSISNSTVNNV